MSNPVEALYKEVVLDHYRNPRNREALDAPDGSALVVNPVCGDQVRVDVAVANGRLDRVTARTRGCSIAVASGSVMTELAAGLTRDAVRALGEALRQLVVEGKPAPDDLDSRLRAFARVADLPSRHRCALLPWEAVEEALDASSAGAREGGSA